MTDIVKIADAGHVRTITLNRPEKKNALSDALAWGVIAAVEDAARTDDVWVIALTAAAMLSARVWICPAANARRRCRGNRLSSMTFLGLDISSWRFANGATSLSSEASMGWPWGPASVSPWRPTCG